MAIWLRPERLAVVDGRGLAFFREKSGAAEHAVAGEGRLQFGRLPGPVQHVRAGDVDEGEADRSSRPVQGCAQDVVQMIGAIEMEGGVRDRPACCHRRGA